MAGPSGIASYSPTPATNATASGGNSNWAENQPASSVNNSVRQDHADLRIAFNDLIWFSYGSGDQAPGVTFLGVPYAYTSANSVTVVGADVTIPHHIGRRMKFVGALTGTVYGTISAVAFGGGNTLITLAMDAAAVLQNEALNGYLCQVPVTGGPIPTAALAPGAITVTVADITNNQNATTQLGIHNNSAGVSATTAVTLDNGTHQGVFYLLGTGYTSAGMNLADGTVVVGKGAGGLSLVSALNQPVYIGVNSGEVARFTSVGLGIGKDPAYTLDMVKSANTGVFAVLSNPNAGNAAYVGFIAGNGTTSGLIYQTGTAFATAGIIRQDGTVVSAGGAGGLTLVTSVNQPIYLGVGGLEVARFTSTGLGLVGPGGTATNPPYTLDLRANSNSGQRISMTNPNAGNAAANLIVLDNGTSLVQLTMTGPGYTPGPPVSRPDGALLWANGAGGLTVCAASNTPVYILSNSVEVARFVPNGTGGALLGTITALGAVCTIGGGYGAGERTLFVNNPMGAPGSGAIIQILQFQVSSPNTSGIYFFACSDSTTNRMSVYSNGGIGNFSANNVNLSDATMKSHIEPLRGTPVIDKLWTAHKSIDWNRHKYHDQTHDDWNYGYTAQGIAKAFADIAPELTDIMDIAPLTELVNEPHIRREVMGVYHHDITNIGGAILTEAQHRIEALEARIAQLERTIH